MHIGRGGNGFKRSTELAHRDLHRVMILGACATVSVASTSFLFLLRVRAVYLQSIYATTIFGTFWLVVTCLNQYLRRDVTLRSTSCAIWILRLLNARSHSCLFADHVHAPITYRLAADAMPTKGRRRFRLFSIVKGKGLYSLSRSLLQGGQLYYFSTILFFLINFAIICSPPTPTGAEYLIAIVYIAFTNMMACRVFRGVALGRMHVEVAGLTSTRIAAVFQ
ncbi:hypothetical protein FIBSPDRAFT_939567 [Athelia psychrophila]|uniref:Uncharacterized protein n=1 Tax=Athelia psychrophila TaxID=1759441 RepID=A0A167XLZ3_9AGAM|nr:hypothetical protein FIBSPDRAFT_939567 [Fibularhizoctonia sp. CBS 109695]